jgi:hypothetical protein
MIVKGHIRSYGLPAVILRLNNVMSPHHVTASRRAPPQRRPTLTPLPLRRRRGRSLRHHPAQGRDRGTLQRRLARRSLRDAGCSPKNRSAYLAQLNSATRILHTPDSKFSGTLSMAVNCTRSGVTQRTRFDAALRMTVDWCGKSTGWFDGIEGVLTVYPVAKRDRPCRATGRGLAVPQTRGYGRCARRLRDDGDQSRRTRRVLRWRQINAGDVRRKGKARSAARVAGHGGSENWRPEDEGIASE